MICLGVFHSVQSQYLWDYYGQTEGDRKWEKTHKAQAMPKKRPTKFDENSQNSQ